MLLLLMERFRWCMFDLFDLHSPDDGDDDVYSIHHQNSVGKWGLWMEQGSDAVRPQPKSFPKSFLIYPRMESLVLPQQVAFPQWEAIQIVYMSYL